MTSRASARNSRSLVGLVGLLVWLDYWLGWLAGPNPGVIYIPAWCFSAFHTVFSKGHHRARQRDRDRDRQTDRTDITAVELGSPQVSGGSERAKRFAGRSAR